MAINYEAWTKSRLVRRIKELEELVFVDALTGLANRRAFDKALEREVARVKRDMGAPLSIAIIDVDFFKKVNDTYGHVVGDRVLEKLGELLGRGVRKTDFVGRMGGEEFVVLMPKTTSSGALLHAQHTRALVDTLLVVYGDGCPSEGVRCTVSVGVATWDSANETPKDFLGRADAALYRAKARGRNRVEC
jgi:two-component system, cell cycle response regulator